MSIKIAPDVPQVILDEFNKLDYEAINSVVKTSMIAFIKQFAKASFIPKDPNKKYASNGIAKKICRNFDEKLLHILNVVDWELEHNKIQIENVLVLIKPFILKLPNRVKNENK